ncbi:MAG: hypothetical protein NTW03_01770 [Verrucomicrobia bacterium]|nr:hypothetical protein [Verrucomicrobiota bacterium]
MNLKKGNAHAPTRTHVQGSPVSPKISSPPAPLEDGFKAAGTTRQPDNWPPKDEPRSAKTDLSDADSPPSKPAAFDRIWAGSPIELRVTPASEAVTEHKLGSKQAAASASGAAQGTSSSGSDPSAAAAKPSVPKQFDRIWAGHAVDVPVGRIHINP